MNPSLSPSELLRREGPLPRPISMIRALGFQVKPPKAALPATISLKPLASFRRTFHAALLHIDSSPRAASVSSRLAAAFVAKWKQQHPAGTVVHHNTSLENIPYLDEAAVDAFFTPAAGLTAEQKRALAGSDRFVDELLAADVLVLGVPMWNLSIPASLKAWIDMIVREGRTFAFTEQGVAPLVPPGKKVFVFSARGGAYPAGTPFHSSIFRSRIYAPSSASLA